MPDGSDADASELAELAALHEATARHRAELGASVHALAGELADTTAMRAYARHAARQAAVRGAHAAWDAARDRLARNVLDGRVPRSHRRDRAIGRRPGPRAIRPGHPARPALAGWPPGPGPAAVLALGACLATGTAIWLLTHRHAARRRPDRARR